MILPDIFCFCILDYQWPYKEYVFVRSFGGGIVAYPVLFANLWLCGFGLHDGCHMWSKNRSLFVRIWFHIPLLFPRRFMWISLYSEFPLVFWGFLGVFSVFRHFWVFSPIEVCNLDNYSMNARCWCPFDVRLYLLVAAIQYLLVVTISNI